MIKLRISWWGDYPGLSKWSNIIITVFIRGRREMGASSRIHDDSSERLEWAATSQGMPQLPAALQRGFSRKGNRSLPKEESPAKRWLQTSGLQNCNRIHFCLVVRHKIRSFVTMATRNQYPEGTKVPLSWLVCHLYQEALSHCAYQWDALLSSHQQTKTSENPIWER